MDIPALHGLCEAMHAAFRQAGPLGQLAHTLGAMVTQTLESRLLAQNPMSVGSLKDD